MAEKAETARVLFDSNDVPAYRLPIWEAWIAETAETLRVLSDSNGVHAYLWPYMGGMDG